MMIADAQVHVWAADRPDRPWIPGGADYAHSDVPLGPEELLDSMDRSGVDRALLVSPTWEGDRNDLVLDAAARHPDRFRAIVRFDVRDRSMQPSLEEWADDPRVAGARVVFAKRSTEWLREGRADWFWPLAERLELPVMVFAPGQYREVAAVAERHPSLRVTLCHLGLDTALRDGEIVPQVDQLLPLAALPNVAVKASSLPSYVTEPYPFPSLHPQIQRVLEAFGRRRVFWGSDLSRLRCTYDELRRLFTHELGLSSDDLEWVMGLALCAWFDWPAKTEVSERGSDGKTPD